MAQKYCPSCGQDVPTETSLEGSFTMTYCSICGLGLGVKAATTEDLRRMRGLPDSAPPQPMSTPPPAGEPALGRVGLAKRQVAVAAAVERPSPPDPRTASTPAAGLESIEHSVASASVERSGEWAPGTSSETSAERRARESVDPARKMRKVMVVEDSTLLRQVTRDLLAERDLAGEVVDCDDGASFLERFTRDTRAGAKADLVVLDVRMPGMDGREAAYAVRAIETALGATKRTPILFFSAMLCDAEFKTALRDIGNARYIRKTEGGDPQELGERIASVLERLVGGK